MTQVHVVEHPLVVHWLTVLRDKTTPPPMMRAAVEAIMPFLLAEATRDLSLEPVLVETPLEATTGYRLAHRVALIPILRAGLAMVPPALRLLPDAPVFHLGIYRDEHTLEPVFYYDPLVGRPRTADVALVLDPMLATGGTVEIAVAHLREWGMQDIRYLGLIAAPEGVERLKHTCPDVPLYVAAVDRQLNTRGYILPGLGDAGDRVFGT